MISFYGLRNDFQCVTYTEVSESPYAEFAYAARSDGLSGPLPTGTNGPEEVLEIGSRHPDAIVLDPKGHSIYRDGNLIVEAVSEVNRRPKPSSGDSCCRGTDEPLGHITHQYIVSTSAIVIPVLT